MSSGLGSLRPIRFIRDEYVTAYRGLPRRAWILFAVNLVNSSGSMVIFFLSLYLTRRLGFTAGQTGWALSLYGVGSLAGAFLGGWFSDRVGSIRVQKYSLVACGAFLIALGQVTAAVALLALLLLFGFFAGMLYPANAASMAKICPPALQVKGFALTRLANNLGATIGPAVGGVLALRDYRLLFWGDGLTSLAAAVVFVALWPGAGLAVANMAGPAPDLREASAALGPEAASGPRARGRSPWRDTPFLLLMLIFLAWSMVFIQLLTTYPLYMRNVYGLAENRIGLLFAVNTILIVTLEMILMERIKKYPIARMINLSFILLGIGLGLMPLGRGFAFGALTVAIWTFGEMLSMPLVGALVAGRADDTNRGRYMGLFSFVFSLGFVLAPEAGMAVYGGLGPHAVWLLCAVISFALAVAFSALRPSLERPYFGGVGPQ